MKDIVAIVLAAGRGTRMKSKIPKVLHNILGKPIILHILDSLGEAGLTDIVTVTGYGSSLLKEVTKGTKIIVQKKLLGSADAVITVKKALGRYSQNVLIICGDTPLIRSNTIKNVIEKHKTSKASLTLLTARLKDPRGYGRIVRTDNAKISRIVEETEASLYEEVINEVNAGVYCFKSKSLFEALSEISAENKKKEFFLTDTVGILHKKGEDIESVLAEDSREIIGVNTRKDLAEATRILKDSVLEAVMSNGVTIEDPTSTTIYTDVRIGQDTVICPYTVIESKVDIGKNCRIGPFAHIRSDVHIGDNVEIGNFVELVRTTVEDGAKIKHHTYLGDALIGKRVNVGAGTITANFDGKNKNKTIIEDGASIGVGAILIAPVRIGQGAILGAGCVVLKNHNVPKGATVVGLPARVIKKNKRGDKR